MTDVLLAAASILAVPYQSVLLFSMWLFMNYINEHFLFSCFVTLVRFLFFLNKTKTNKKTLMGCFLISFYYVCFFILFLHFTTSVYNSVVSGGCIVDY